MSLIKISQISQLPTIQDTDLILITRPGTNFTVKFSDFKKCLSQVTKDSLGLSKVENYSTKDMPLSDAATAALGEKADKSHSHSVNDIAGLSNVLDSKANKVHGHGISDIDGLTSELLNLKNRLDGLSGSTDTDFQLALDNIALDIQSLIRRISQLENKPNPTYTINEITGLVGALASKANSTSVTDLTKLVTDLQNNIENLTLDISSINGLTTTLESFALKTHVHLASQITDFGSAVLAVLEANKHTHVIDDIDGLRLALESKANQTFVINSLATKLDKDMLTVTASGLDVW